MVSPPLIFANEISINWEFDNYPPQFGAADRPEEKVRFFVNDPNLANNLITDSIDVIINSFSLVKKNPDGSPFIVDTVSLTLEETGDTGTFQNENLVFLKSTIYPLDEEATLQIFRECTLDFPLPGQHSGNCNSSEIDTLELGEGARIISASDPTGIDVELMEFALAVDGSLFLDRILLSSTTSSESLGQILVSPGDVFTVIDLLSLKFTNGLVEPISQDIGGIFTPHPGADVSVLYNGKSATTSVGSEDLFPLISEFVVVPGRGGGGAVNRGLLVDSGGMGDMHPTLGLDLKGTRLVEDGFSYNGNSVNVQEFFTSYDLVDTEIGKLNEAKLKIYDDKGPDKIEFVGIAFGLSKNQYFGDSEVSISLEQTLLGQKITTKDPNGVLKDVDVKTTTAPCSKTNQAQCLVVTFYHRFQGPLEHQMIGTYVWDKNRSAWQNFFNHGIKITGESTIPPKEYFGIDKGNLVHLFETEKNEAIDLEGNVWIYNKEWRMEFTPKGKIDDGVTKHGIDRGNARFDVYKKGQELLAQHTMNKILGGTEIYNTSFDEVETIYYSILSRSEDLDLQRKILYEESRARDQNAKLFDFKINH